MSHLIQMKYDSKYDVLRLCFISGSVSYGDEDDDGLVIMRDAITDDITGITIFDFASKYKKSMLPRLPNELNISFEKDVLPSLNIS